MSELASTLDKVKARISQYGSRAINEADTKSTLIQPVLRALGWDPEDLEDVQREYKCKKSDNPVDYALMLLRSPRLFVEAKALDKDLDDRKWSSQSMGYATVAGVEWVVLTNGDEYRIYNAHAPVPVEDKLFRKVRISDNSGSPRETLELLSKDRIRENDINTLWKAHFVDRQVRGAIEELFSNDGEPDVSLVRWIRRRAPMLKIAEVKASLSRVRIQIDYPVDPGRPPSEGTSTGRQGRPVSTNVDTDLRELIEAGLLEAPLTLFKRYKDHDLEATLREDGVIEFDGKACSSCSDAATTARQSVIGKRLATNGWEWWRYRGENGELVPMDTARQAFLSRNRDD